MRIRSATRNHFVTALPVLAVLLFAYAAASDDANVAVSAAGQRFPGPGPSQTAIYVSTRAELVNALYAVDELGRPYFTTIYVANNAVINLTGFHSLPLRTGVTLMSGRGGVQPGALLYKSDFAGGQLFDVVGDDVRVRGLRLRGPSPLPVLNETVAAIRVRVNRYRGLEVTDNELFQWTHAGVSVRNFYSEGTRDEPYRTMEASDARQIYIARNYIHHNLRRNGGYGVAVSDGAYAVIEGNVFDYNRHAITSDGQPRTGYIARFNYILQGGHCEDAEVGCFYNQHFDVHGSGEGGYGGVGGEFFDIAYNSFRGEQTYGPLDTKTRPAVMVRATPTIGLYFYGNVLVHNLMDAIQKKDGDFFLWDEDIDHVYRGANAYDSDPSRDMATGDFDGDGRQDVFLATRASWYYSSSGMTEWRFLSPTTTRLANLRFGDFNGDGKTDVFTQVGARWLYSSGGRQPWAPLAAIGFYPLESYRFGDFNGDGRTDVFRTDGTYWYVSWSGRDDWEMLKRSDYQVGDIRLADFDGDGTTDVFSLALGNWSWSMGGSGPWTRLNDQLTTDLKSLVFADFDGNGVTDIAQRSGDYWRYARDGRGGWTGLRSFAGLDAFRELRTMLVADFDGRPGAEALTYGSGNRFVSWSRLDGPWFFTRSGSMR